MTEPTAMPLQVRHAAKVCSCGHLETEHNLTPVKGRGVCSHQAGAQACGCGGYSHAVDRYRVSTYVDVAAGQAAPQMALQHVVTQPDRVMRCPVTLWGRRERCTCGEHT